MSRTKWAPGGAVPVPPGSGAGRAVRFERPAPGPAVGVTVQIGTARGGGVHWARGAPRGPAAGWRAAGRAWAWPDPSAVGPVACSNPPRPTATAGRVAAPRSTTGRLPCRALRSTWLNLEELTRVSDGGMIRTLEVHDPRKRRLRWMIATLIAFCMALPFRPLHAAAFEMSGDFPPADRNASRHIV